MRLVYFSESILPSRPADSVHVMKMYAALAAQGRADVEAHYTWEQRARLVLQGLSG